MIKTGKPRRLSSTSAAVSRRTSTNVKPRSKQHVGTLSSLPSSQFYASSRFHSDVASNMHDTPPQRKTATDVRLDYLNRKLAATAVPRTSVQLSPLIPDLNAPEISTQSPSSNHSGASLRKMLSYDDEEDSHLYQSSAPYEEPQRHGKPSIRARHQHGQVDGTTASFSGHEDISVDDEESRIKLPFSEQLPEIQPFSPHELLSKNMEHINPITNLQALSLAVLNQREERFALAARPVFWHGLQGDDEMQLPSLEQELPNVDWRTFLDLTQPHLWYPMARMLERKIIYHAGPTNSGKTHRAMNRLQEAKSGLYCGPLRLLAWENFERLNRNTMPCSLLTGQEVVEIPGAQHISTTVEMVNMERIVDVAVIDEIQMIQDPKRGFGWTRALLGVPAKEVHVCGDATVLQWLQEITKMTGEELHINQYKRLSPLEVQPAPVQSYSHLKKGDCVVAFTRKEVYAIKRKIEEETGRKVAIIYGNLPPAVRKQQANLFNDPQSGVDILVASDAIGMGLNLNIGRIIFSSITKFDGEQFRKLTQTEVLQIGGRAGRYNSIYHHGKVTVMQNQDDLEYIRQQFSGSLPPMQQARLFPSTEHLLTLCKRFPEVKLSDYLYALPKRAKLSKFFTMSEVDDIAELAKVIDDIDMPAYNRVMLCYAPLSLERFKTHRALLLHYAEALLQDKAVSIPRLTYAARPTVPSNMAEIALLEETYSNLDLYVWLWYRMGDVFHMHKQAKMDLEGVATLIHTALSRASVAELRGYKQPKAAANTNPDPNTNTNTDHTRTGDAEEQHDAVTHSADGDSSETKPIVSSHPLTNHPHLQPDSIEPTEQHLAAAPEAAVSERDAIRRLIRSDAI